MKTIYTTGEAADVCKVSQQTIIRCFDAGRLRGFRIPGSRFRRIPHEALIDFMRDNGIPEDNLTAAMDDQARKARILVVDDDADLVDLFCDILERDGRFEAHSAGSGYEAGLLTSELRPDLILLDYRLPDINGNVVCKAIRAKAELSDTKIILLSGTSDSAEVEELLAAGADAFVRKPCNVEQLVAKIATMLEV